MNISRPACILIGSVASLLNLGAVAADWNGSVSNNWNDPGNWSTGLVPAAGVDAYINVIPTNVATIAADLAATPQDIRVADGVGTAGRLDHKAGFAATGDSNWFYVGTEGGTGTYNLANTSATGGTLTGFGLGSGSTNVGGNSTNAGRLYVGGTAFGPAGGTGTVNVNTSGTLNVRNDLVAGVNGGTGVVNVDAGTITTGGWNFFGKDEVSTGGNGTLNMSGGTLTNAGRTYVGLGNTTGKIQMSGGTYNNLNDRFIIGENNFANPTVASVSLTGGTLNSALLNVGGQADQPGTGTLTINGANALVNANGEVWVGNRATSVGALTVNSGTLTANNWIAVGRDGGTGTLNLSGGIIRKTGGGNSHIIFGSLGGKATVTQTGGLIETVGGGDFRLGENNGSQADWTMSGGTANADGFRIGWIGGGAGNLTVGTSAVINAGFINIAEGGAGTVKQTGGTINVSGNFDIQASAGNSGSYTFSGGVLSVNGQISTDNGTFTWTGGKITRSDALAPISFSNDLTTGAAAATLGLNGGATFVVGGILNKTAGITLDLTGRIIPAYDGTGTDTGSFTLGTVASMVGQFGPASDFVIGLTNNGNATFISEAQGEAAGFNADTQSVYWIQENGGLVTLNYSLVPEPSSVALLAIGGMLIGACRRRDRR